MAHSLTAEQLFFYRGHVDRERREQQWFFDRIRPFFTLDEVRDRDVVDFGSGLGSLAIEIAMHTPRSVVGVEISEDYRSFGDHHLRTEHPHLAGLIRYAGSLAYRRSGCGGLAASTRHCHWPLGESMAVSTPGSRTGLEVHAPSAFAGSAGHGRGGRPSQPGYAQSHGAPMNRPPHVVVISHERSGTHITIDAVRNNFIPYKERYYVNIDLMIENSWKSLSSNECKRELQSGPVVVKTHTFSNHQLFFHSNPEAIEIVGALIEGAKCIYVYRDGRDVLSSFYMFLASQYPNVRRLSLSEFLSTTNLPCDPIRASMGMNPVEYWRDHVEGWLGNGRALALSFESFLRDYEGCVDRISEFIGVPARTPYLNVLRSSKTRLPASLEPLYKLYLRKIRNLDLTSVSFRKGQVGGARRHFGPSELAYFDRIASGLMTRLGYYAG